jgi:hypothetical protein
MLWQLEKTAGLPGAIRATGTNVFFGLVKLNSVFVADTCAADAPTKRQPHRQNHNLGWEAPIQSPTDRGPAPYSIFSLFSHTFQNNTNFLTHFLGYLRQQSTLST